MAVSREQFARNWDETFVGKWVDGPTTAIEYGINGDKAFIRCGDAYVEQPVTDKTQFFLRVQKTDFSEQAPWGSVDEQ